VVFAKYETVLQLAKQVNYQEFFTQSRERTNSLEATKSGLFLYSRSPSPSQQDMKFSYHWRRRGKKFAVKKEKNNPFKREH